MGRAQPERAVSARNSSSVTQPGGDDLSLQQWQHDVAAAEYKGP